MEVTHSCGGRDRLGVMKPNLIAYGDNFVYRESGKTTKEVMFGPAPEFGRVWGEIRVERC
jgi:hypothetical protein